MGRFVGGYNKKEYICRAENKYNCNMYTIQANESGTRSIDIDEQHLLTIDRYNLFEGLCDSVGIIDEGVLDKLKMTVRSLIISSDGDKDLLDLCCDVVYHNNMKAYGLRELIRLYAKWVDQQMVPEI